MAYKKTTKKSGWSKKPTKAWSKKKNPYRKRFLELQKEINAAMRKLEMDLKRKSPASKIHKDNHHFLILLGEMNYIARECYKFDRKIKKAA